MSGFVFRPGARVQVVDKDGGYRDIGFLTKAPVFTPIDDEQTVWSVPQGDVTWSQQVTFQDVNLDLIRLFLCIPAGFPLWYRPELRALPSRRPRLNAVRHAGLWVCVDGWSRVVACGSLPDGLLTALRASGYRDVWLMPAKPDRPVSTSWANGVFL